MGSATLGYASRGGFLYDDREESPMRVLVVIPHYATTDAGHNPEGRVHGSLTADLSPRVPP